MQEFLLLRDYSSSVAFVTAVNKPGMTKEAYWEHLAMVLKHCVFIWGKTFA